MGAGAISMTGPGGGLGVLPLAGWAEKCTPAVEKSANLAARHAPRPASRRELPGPPQLGQDRIV